MTDKIVLKSGFSDFSVDLEYEFDLVQSKEEGINRSFTTIGNKDPRAARHFGFRPGENNPTLRWILFDNGEDKSNGSLSASNISDARFSNQTVTTLQEQIIWIQQFIMDNSSDARYRLFGGRFSDYNGDGIEEGTPVVIKNPRITQSSDRPTTAEGKIQLKLGVTI
jgi:hypothetical protein